MCGSGRCAVRIACFDNVGNYGGASRYTRALLLALKSVRPELEITYFGNRTSIERENFGSEFSRCGIGVSSFTGSVLHDPGIRGDIARAITKRLRRYAPSLVGRLHIDQVHRKIEKAAVDFDLAFFPWNYLMECPDTACPMVTVFHDFNFKYNFGWPVYGPADLKLMDAQFPIWLNRSTPVVSSKFTAGELEKFYPEYAHKTRIIHLAPFSIDQLSDEEALRIIERIGIAGPYIVYPTNLSHHKNVDNLLRAFFIVKNRYRDLRLVLTGSGTESLTGSITRYGVERNAECPDVMGLGYVTNEQMDALIQCARIVISTSVYEAGNGPGLDAWIKGTPVLMSNIDSFVEHREVLGVRARLCDPLNARDIAKQIIAVLTDYRRARKDAVLSRKEILKYTWAMVAEKYYEVFLEAATGRRDAVARQKKG